MTPPVAVKLNATLVLPATLTLKICVPPVAIVAVVGVMPSVITFTVAVADFVGSAMLVAVTVIGPVVEGAVNKIEFAADPGGAADNVPPVAEKLTAVPPGVTALKIWVFPPNKVTLNGLMVIAAGGPATTVMNTVAVADLVVSATLVTFTVAVVAASRELGAT